MKNKTIYFAGPLFTRAEIEFNLKASEYLKKHGFEVFLPQEACEGMHGKDIFETCRNGIDSSNVVLANVDGADADSGTCWECGYAYAKGIPIIAYRTDFRLSGDTKGFNAMVYFSANAVIEEQNNYLDKITAAIKSVIKSTGRLKVEL
ncbi:MAG: nucleoside 2-deoxyribosyltransferase [Bacteroidia bacterium]